MKTAHALVALAAMTALICAVPILAQSQVKWSAPMHMYPRPWNPTPAPPPSYYNLWGYYNPYQYYGYGGGYGGSYGVGYQGYPQYYGGQAYQNYGYYYGQ